jgi:hypothetical protein
MRTILKWFARKGWCLHPAFAVEVFHFSGSRERCCGYLCNLCMGAIDIPTCTARGICLRELAGVR